MFCEPSVWEVYWLQFKICIIPWKCWEHTELGPRAWRWIEGGRERQAAWLCLVSKEHIYLKSICYLCIPF